MNGILKIFPLLFLFLLTACGSGRGSNVVSLDSTNATVDITNSEACFTTYKDESELTTHINYFTGLLEDSQKVNYSRMNVLGCVNYQLGNYSLAEEWLKKSFEGAQKGDTAKYTAAYALILIYLKEFQVERIAPIYIDAAEKSSYGRWAIILYYIEQYRVSRQRGYLVSAIEQMQAKYNEEDPPAVTTEQFLKRMQHINGMESTCKNDPNREACLENGDLVDQKRYLFAAAHGLLAMFIKSPPFNRPITEEAD